MADEQVTTGTLTAVETPVLDSPKESASELKEKIQETKTPVEVPKETSKVTKNVTTSTKSPVRETDTKSSDDIKKQIQEQSAKPVADEKKVVAPDETEDRSKWFDPDKGFKTAEDMRKSYGELQDSFRKKSEEIKTERGKLEIEQAHIKSEIEKIKAIQSERTLTPEEVSKQEAIKDWQIQNKEALDLIKDTIKKELDSEKQVEKSNEIRSSIESQILKERQDWLESFNKDSGRKQLWPMMEQVFKEKGDTADLAVKDFSKNPLPYIEAMAFQKNFPNIAEQIKAEAVEQYKAQVKEAAEAERTKGFARSGGAKLGAGDVDISKLSSSELGTLLPRNENG